MKEEKTRLTCQICYIESLKEKNFHKCDKCSLLCCHDCLKKLIIIELKNLRENISCSNVFESCSFTFSEKYIYKLFGSYWYQETFLKKR